MKSPARCPCPSTDAVGGKAAAGTTEDTVFYARAAKRRCGVA